MLTVAFALGVCCMLGWMTFRRSAAVIAATFLLFSLVTRMVSLVVVDLGPEIHSEQLDTFIGNGQSMPLFACSIAVLLAALATAFRPSVLARIRPPPLAAHDGPPFDGVRIACLTATICYVAALYADMVARGPVPLIAGMDRLEYNIEYAGPLHGLLLDYGFLLASTLGAMFVRPRLRGRDFDFAFLGVYGAVLGYFALTGNRFSAFYSFTSFFVMPLACVAALHCGGKLKPAPMRPAWKRLVFSPWVLLGTLALGIVGVSGLILHSVVNVRDYDDPVNLLVQRVLVQPVEMWWVTWRDLDTPDRMSFDSAWTLLFSDPIDPQRNTSVQMLMAKSIGFPRTAELLDMGQQYAGGYPEVLFELLGRWLALPAALVLSVPTALLLRLVVVAVCEDRLLTALMALYVFFGFSLLFVGGMLNFLIVWSFWAKIAALACAYVLEHPRSGLLRRRALGARLTPVAPEP